MNLKGKQRAVKCAMLASNATKIGHIQIYALLVIANPKVKRFNATRILSGSQQDCNDFRKHARVNLKENLFYNE